MGTVSKAIAQDVIRGKYKGDPVSKVVSYNNMFDGGLTYALVYDYEFQFKYEHSPACKNVKTLWTDRSGFKPDFILP